MKKLNRKIKPASSGKITFHLPEISEFTLNNGMKVHFVKKEKLPIVKMILILPAGSRYDNYGLEGLSYLTALLIDEGTEKYDSLQFDYEVDKLGSSIDISTSADHTFISLMSLKENFKRSLELYSMLLTEPRFDEESFEREKKKHLTKILQSYDNPAYLAYNAFQKNVFKGTFYEIPMLGYAESVTSIHNHHIKNFKRKFYHSPDTKLVVVGDMQKDELQNKLNEQLTKLELKSFFKKPEFKKENENKKLYFIHKEDAAQTEIIGGHLTSRREENNYFAAKLANSILGGQFSSRINLNLREEKGYTYGANSSLSYNDETGYFSVSASVQSEFTLNSILELQKEINNIREDISEKEIEFSKSYLIKRFPSLFETYSQVAQNISLKIIHNLPDNYYDNYIPSLRKCTKEEILAAANQHFLPDKMKYFIVGDRNKLLDELKEKSGFEVTELDKLGNLTA